MQAHRTSVLRSVGYNRNKPYNYMMIPTSMTMDMHMVMVMYGITDRLTVMAMANYQANEMKMIMDMGPTMGIFPSAPMSTSGFGDTELRGMYRIDKYLVGSLGLSLPTGSIKERSDVMGMIFRAPYDMQLGSGTYDLKPALTYNGVSRRRKMELGRAGSVHLAYVKERGQLELRRQFQGDQLAPARLWTRNLLAASGL